MARCFGEPNQYPLVRGLPECPLVIPVIKEPHERVNFGGLWRSDTTYLEQPPMALERGQCGGQACRLTHT